jgi:hypothetical protein
VRNSDDAESGESNPRQRKQSEHGYLLCLLLRMRRKCHAHLDLELNSLTIVQKPLEPQREE